MLQIANLSKTYANGVQALRDVTLDIPRGMFGLLGPNGAGKSTLMRTIATLQEADSGSITLDGLDVLRQKEEVRQVLGYLPQEFGVYPRISAETLLDHFALLKGISRAGERKAVVQALLQQTNLWDVRKRNLGTYSGGMRQRFGIAQALLGDPKLIIVDEPTAGLDPQERNRFLNLLSEIGENVVIILSTHIVEDVSDLCTRMAIISQGRVLRSGDPKEVIESLHGTIWEKAITKTELADYQKRLHVISSRLFAGRVLIHVVAAERPEEGFEPIVGNLEDVYFQTLRQAETQAA
ncbi:MAG TPA: ABC transporter ATP-binding protein [Thermoanaerobaculia bacterium]